MLICKICQKEFENGKRLSNHLKDNHKLSSEEYTIKYLCQEIPKCPICGMTPRYVGFTFKKYCTEHSHSAMSEGGKKGGRAEAWNKGKTKESDERLLKQSINNLGENNHFFGKHHDRETLEKLKLIKRVSQEEYEKRIKEVLEKQNLIILTSYEEYFSRQHQYLNVRCKICNNEEIKTLQSLERGSLCKKCFPENTSQAEQEIKDYILSLGLSFQNNIRNIINPYELDLYIPEKQFAIEYNGLYWHSELFFDKHISKDYHLVKYNLCKDKNISLFHIFADEWRDKKEIVKSMISYRVGMIKNKIFARKCEIREVEKEEGERFFNESHLNGWVRSDKIFGLYIEDKLVSAISLRIPLHKKYENYVEIARFASLPFTVVSGGISKLINRVVKYGKELGYIGLLSYAEKRLGERRSYEKAGFQYVEDTEIDFWWTDGTLRYNRFKFRARDGKSELEIAKEFNVAKIYGCGHNIFVLNFRNKNA